VHNFADLLSRVSKPKRNFHGAVPRARGSVAEWLKMLCRGNKDDDHLGLARRKTDSLPDSAWEFLATHSLFSFRPCKLQ
jgi:hypothetical protein